MRKSLFLRIVPGERNRLLWLAPLGTARRNILCGTNL